jgi:ATP-binding cassette subfamily B protein
LLKEKIFCYTIKIESLNGNININNLFFCYKPNDYILNNINLLINKGDIVAFVGETGSGKTTLAQLLVKFYNMEKGDIFYDDTNIKEIDGISLRNNIAYLPQEPFIFSGTIKENIALFNNIYTIDEIIEATKKSGAYDFIKNLPERYDTTLYERGDSLSGGQKQKIAISRLFLKKASIFIFDEPTNNLDSISENLFMNMIMNLKSEKKTVILIEHKLKNIINCDKIFVFKDGSIIESGTHYDLIKLDSYYSKLWGKQK